ncbi:hypothetical protein QFZ81_000151 [Paenibacillus sp. V4I9]|uniref:hypothetical protein n=1 Tax=Paenibacillus sp. V4I9 TaxID=3042308 RepID=UPI00277E8F53|nr:hypothetical protein [Paenibacillus sp. V4I9]MDQ0885063.1 hypothetical protein [Paenibacillus sp. V4I9]
MTYLSIFALIVVIFFLSKMLSSIHFSRSAFKRKSELISKELFEFLEKADDAYILTHEAIEISFFSKYATSHVCNEVMESIYKNPAKLFGTKKYRERIWCVMQQQKNEIVLRKEISHKRIKVRKGIKVALGDDMVEYWTISHGADGFLVEDVS